MNDNAPDNKDALDDIKYFTDKMKAAEAIGDIEGVKRYKRKLELMEDAVVIYRLGKEPDKTFTTI